jgi:hypothetical protein
MVLALSILNPNLATAEQENCRTFNFKETFYFGFEQSSATWTVPGSKRTLTWSILDSGELNGKRIQGSFSTLYKSWLIEAIASWDEALESISFKEVASNEPADIRIGWTQVLQLDYESLFNVKTPDGIRKDATLEFKHSSTFLIVKENFIQAAQSDIGHILGMGYITPSEEITSVMEWPFQGPYGQVPLGEFDVSLIRAIYGESTCPTTFSSSIQAKIKEVNEAITLEKARLAAEEKARLKAEADERARLELYWINIGKELAEKEAKIKADQAAAKAAASVKKTIVCIKGKQTKKVVAINPKCPSGYKKR